MGMRLLERLSSTRLRGGHVRTTRAGDSWMIESMVRDRQASRFVRSSEKPGRAGFLTGKGGMEDRGPPELRDVDRRGGEREGLSAGMRQEPGFLPEGLTPLKKVSLALDHGGSEVEGRKRRFVQSHAENSGSRACCGFSGLGVGFSVNVVLPFSALASCLLTPPTHTRSTLPLSS